VSEHVDEDHNPANLAHHFLFAICTRPGFGLCFKDRGWYPRIIDDGDVAGNASVEDASGADINDAGAVATRVYNKILANVLRGLKPLDDGRQRALLVGILRACPELVTGLWQGLRLALEPHLTARWLATVSLLGEVVALPVPHDCFRTPGVAPGVHATSSYSLTPPPLVALLENVLPSVGTRVHLTRALQATTPLVRHTASMALAQCLKKLGAVCAALRAVEAVMGEVDDGPWSLRRHELERAARVRVPDFHVIIALAQQTSGADAIQNPIQAALLGEAAHRLLWLYHAHLPGLVAENRFDRARLLQNNSEDDAEKDAEMGPVGRMCTLRRLHGLRILGEADQFILLGKSGLFLLYVSRSHVAR
jgi:nucleolar pre-ribosomal-associated protein 1